MVSSLGLVLSDGALGSRAAMDSIKNDSFYLLKCTFSLFRLAWCLLMMSLSLLACLGSTSGDKKTMGRVKQLFYSKDILH